MGLLGANQSLPKAGSDYQNLEDMLGALDVIGGYRAVGAYHRPSGTCPG